MLRVDADAGVCSSSSALASLGQLMKYGTTKSVVRASSVYNHGFGKASELYTLIMIRLLLLWVPYPVLMCNLLA